ncbi:hypothetical protein ACFL27_25840, partial [candidate division CSSED10-310 bacterium]
MIQIAIKFVRMPHQSDPLAYCQNRCQTYAIDFVIVETSENGVTPNAYQLIVKTYFGNLTEFNQL